MLKGQAKRDYQRGYMAQYMRGYRALGRDLNVKTSVKTQPVSRKDLLRPDVKTQIKGLVMDGNTIIGLTQAPAPVKAPEVYIPGRHYQAGDVVMVQRGRRMIESTVPALDADGQPIPD